MSVSTWFKLYVYVIARENVCITLMKYWISVRQYWFWYYYSCAWIKLSTYHIDKYIIIIITIIITIIIVIVIDTASTTTTTYYYFLHNQRMIQNFLFQSNFQYAHLYENLSNRR